MKIEILNTDPFHPINPYLRLLKLNLAQDHSISILRSVQEVTTGDLLFLVSCSEKVDREIVENFKHAMVLHASDLPNGRGWSPHIWEIIGGAEQITVSLLDAAGEVDCGDIYRKVTINIPKSALWETINELLFNAEIELIKFAIENFDNLQKTSQRADVKATYYRKRTPKDSEIDPNTAISEQFDLIRVCDPNRFPAVFNYRGETYKLILEKL